MSEDVQVELKFYIRETVMARSSLVHCCLCISDRYQAAVENVINTVSGR